ncbi:hypothetical protein KUCAC02_024670 [Chaenocephalus aceratus]|uniref:Uncharacterized protein n=1 Tax=Chaenocephalus aceratus TaxID=36190 RepID=A0ACB9WIX3_CHAAC|nr:hypothetical protein KUCAC02_024670 [Chaenocephalus aceratus]
MPCSLPAVAVTNGRVSIQGLYPSGYAAYTVHGGPSPRRPVRLDRAADEMRRSSLGRASYLRHVIRAVRLRCSCSLLANSNSAEKDPETLLLHFFGDHRRR